MCNNKPIFPLFLVPILLAGFVYAQSIPDIQLRIEGPDEVQVGSRAEFKAVVDADEGGSLLARHATLEWVFNGKVIRQGDVFEYRADRVGAWQIKARLVQTNEQGAIPLASTTHTLIATRESSIDAQSAQAPMTKLFDTTDAHWRLMDSKVETNRIRSMDGQNKVSISGASYVGTYDVPCVGKAVASLSWTEPPAGFVPGATLSMMLSEQLELVVDTNCPSPAALLEATLNATWSTRKGSQMRQAAVTLSESARQAVEKFTKSKIVTWPAPLGTPNEQLVIEIQAESPAGIASKRYTYIFHPKRDVRSLAVGLQAGKTWPLLVKLEKKFPKGDRVFAGESAVFSATILSGTSRIENVFVQRWRAEPAAFFKLHGGSVSAVFTKPGPAQVWCEVLRSADAPDPLAVSDRASLEVVGAQLDIVIEPRVPRVGEEVTATVLATNVLKGAEMHWLPLPSNVRVVSRASDGRLIRFYLADTNAASLQIQSRQPGGAVLGGASATVQAKPFEVSISGPVPGSPIPQLWVPASGLVKITNALAVEQNFSFGASVKNVPKEAVLTYLWDAQEAGCSIRPPMFQQADILCMETGHYTIGVTVRDARGVELGKASAGFEITISREELQAAWNCAKADHLAREAASLEQQGRKEDAIAKYRESLAVWVDETIKKRAQELASTVAAEQEQKARLAEIIRKGHELEQEGDFVGALKKYRESLTIQMDEQIEQCIAKIESNLARREADRVQAHTLREQADQFIRTGRLKDALDNLKQSLQFEANTQVDQRVAQLETQIAAQEVKKAKAVQLRDEGDLLEEAGDLDAALAKLKESLVECPDDSLKTRVEILEQSRVAEKARMTKATQLQEEGVALEGQGDLEKATGKYRESLALHPNGELKLHVDQLDKTIAKKKVLAAEAAGLRDKGFTLETQGKLDEALATYLQSLDKAPDAELEQRVKDLQSKIFERENRKVKAREFLTLALKLEQEGRLHDAMEACRKSLDLLPDLAVLDQALALEAKLMEREAKQTRAAELALEAQMSKEQGDLAAAVAKYRESLAVWPDAEMEERVRKLEGDLEAENALQTKVKEIVMQAEMFELEGKEEEAIAKYRESLEFQANSEIENRMLFLQKQHADRRATEERAVALKAQAELLEHDGQLAEALILYRQSLELVADDDLAKRVENLKNILIEEKVKKTQAARLAKEAFDLERQGKMAESLARHKESLAQWPDAELEKRAKILENVVIAETAKKEKAAELKQAGAALEKTGNLEGAVERYRSSLELAAEAELLKHVQELEAQVAANQARLAKARDLMEEGRLLELDGKLETAAEKYRASLVLQTNGELQARLSAVENEMAQREAKVAEVERLKQQAANMASAGRVMEAIRVYEQSLALVQDPEVEKQVKTLQASLVQQESKKMQAAKLSKEAYELERQGKIEQALVKHKESLAQWPDAELAKRVRTLENMLAAETSRKDRAAKLNQAGAALEEEGRLEAAVAKYRTSLDEVSDVEIEKKVAELDRALAQQNANRASVKRLWQEAARLEDDGFLVEAVSTLKESLQLDPNPKVQRKVAALEKCIADEQSKIQEARVLAADALKKERAGNLEDAIVLFRKSMKFIDDDSLEKHVASLEAALAVKAAKRAQAQRLKDEGNTFEQQGMLEQAILKYQESLNLWPNNDLVGHLASIQGRMSAQRKTMAEASRLRDAARLLERKGDLQAAIGKYGESIRIAQDPVAEQRMIALQKRVDQREKKQGKADELWIEGTALLSKKRNAEALVSMLMSLQYFYREDRARFLKQIETQEAVVSPPAGLEARPPLPLGGTSWAGVMLIRGQSGTMQWPIHVKVENDDSINSDYEVQDISSSKRYALHIEGTYVLSSRRFNLQFQQSEQGQISVRGVMTGEALSSTVSGGDARLSTAAAGAIFGTGIWRMARQ